MFPRKPRRDIPEWLGPDPRSPSDRVPTEFGRFSFSIAAFFIFWPVWVFVFVAVDSPFTDVLRKVPHCVTQKVRKSFEQKETKGAKAFPGNVLTTNLCFLGLSRRISATFPSASYYFVSDERRNLFRPS